jgi:hypothetical protein
MGMMALIVALSVAVIVLTAITVWRLRAERRRSEARILALAAAMDDPRWAAPVQDIPDFASEGTPAPVSLVVPDSVRPWRAPAFVAAGVIVVTASALLAVGLGTANRAPRTVRSATRSSIELVAMRHALDDETLIVSGAVRNPTASATPALSAIVSVLGPNGEVVARGESRIDPVVLEPGKETTFRVLVSDVGAPGRYRVAFVNGSQIVPHVDRRGDLAQAALADDARGN